MVNWWSRIHQRNSKVAFWKDSKTVPQRASCESQIVNTLEKIKVNL